METLKTPLEDLLTITTHRVFEIAMLDHPASEAEAEYLDDICNLLIKLGPELLYTPSIEYLQMLQGHLHKRIAQMKS